MELDFIKALICAPFVCTVFGMVVIVKILTLWNKLASTSISSSLDVLQAI